MPNELRGETAGKKTRGTASVTLAAAGKAMMRAGATEALSDSEALQASRVVGWGCKAVQEPAEAAVVEALDQQAQAVQPGVWRAAAAQQQPPRHWLEAQSKFEAHASPGEYVWQEPVAEEQALQPIRAAAALQQKPPRQAPEGHEELETQPRLGAAPARHCRVPGGLKKFAGQQSCEPATLVVKEGQGRQLIWPGAGCEVLAGHGEQEEGEALPEDGLKVPAGQGTARGVPGQKWPGRQRMGTPVEQEKEGGQGTQVILRIVLESET